MSRPKKPEDASAASQPAARASKKGGASRPPLTAAGSKVVPAVLVAAMLMAGVWAVLRGRLTTPKLAEPADCQGAEACQKACSAGDRCACGTLGALYLHGSSVARDVQRGLSMLDRACDDACTAACWAAGNAFQNSAGVRADAAKAKFYFDRVNSVCRKGCDEGDPDRCFTLAGSYLGEHGVMPDHARADDLYARAATLYEPLCDKDSAHACARLALLEDHGLGMEEAKANATSHYVKACDLGDAEACEEAAKLTSGHDKDVPANEALSARLAGKACDAGRATGCALANRPDDFMRIVGAACEAGSAFDCGSEAFALFHGAHGVAKNPARAVPLAAKMIELEQDACLGDDGSACAALVRPFDTGTVEGEPVGSIVPKDPTRVAALKQRACDLGFRSACPKAAPPAPAGNGGPAPRP